MDLITLGFTTLFNPIIITMLIIGLLAGLVIGSIPGLNDNIAFAVFIPFSFGMAPEPALALMVGVYCGTATGGAIPAIMINVPGTAAALLTSVNGYAMACQNKAGKALSIAITSSVFGGLASSLVLLMFAPLLASIALRFGYIENFSLTILGLSSVIGLLAGNILKGIASALIGLLAATIGFSPITGYPRYTFDNVNLSEGIPFIPLLVGVFGVAAIIDLFAVLVRARLQGKSCHSLPKIGSMRLKRSLIKRLLPVWLTSSAIGNFIGILPGAGMLIAIYMAYSQAARRFANKYADKKGEYQWGEGTPEGIAAPESANNAVTASSMVPLLSLGIPGNSTSALFIGAMALHGLVPGPLLFTQHANIAWMIIVAFLVANLVMWPMAYIVIKSITRSIFSIPKEALVGIITLLCLLGAYSDGNNIFNVWVALSAGVVAYLMNITNVPLGPAILGLVLGRQLESSLGNSLSISDGNWLVFVDVMEHPISFGLIAVSVLMWLLPVYKYFRNI